MRLAEKTIELNFCTQFQSLFSKRIIWFGLTQKQEAKAGFDACAKMGGRLLLFQFKASCEDRNGSRRFHAQHHQMLALRQRAGHFMRSVFYVLPMIGTTQELQAARGDLISNTYFLDVARMRGIPAPTTKAGKLRKSGYHYIDVQHGQTKNPYAIIRSEPQKELLLRAAEFAVKNTPGADGFSTLEKVNVSKAFSGCAVGAIIPPAR
jgi:hypothetical protein